MAIATLTSKGQITVPRMVRERLRLKAGDKIDFRIESDGSVSLVPLAVRVEDVYGVLSGYARKASVPVEEMNRILGESFRRKSR